MIGYLHFPKALQEQLVTFDHGEKNHSDVRDLYDRVLEMEDMGQKSEDYHLAHGKGIDMTKSESISNGWLVFRIDSDQTNYEVMVQRSFFPGFDNLQQVELIDFEKNHAYRFELVDGAIKRFEHYDYTLKETFARRDFDRLIN